MLLRQRFFAVQADAKDAAGVTALAWLGQGMVLLKDRFHVVFCPFLMACMTTHIIILESDSRA